MNGNETASSPPATTIGQPKPLTHRSLAMLRAVAAGRGQLSGSAEPDLFIDGMPCCDQFAAHALTHDGLVRPGHPGSVGQRVPAVLTPAGAALVSGAGAGAVVRAGGGAIGAGASAGAVVGVGGTADAAIVRGTGAAVMRGTGATAGAIARTAA
ncbi:hypothetical protein BAY61_13940 [Prauserella marina]|uniref:Uncharacterized protein n=1 Tax=Prauserella marina TaxID=530584 RepID=A0A222VPW3_9PSEU|nr:hypothetical protein BAY61_13940 [Prauserella marina]PWV84148.1 hypothetical protein DES30_101165 [Prauserella marina]SDC29300.1 hypothetical protein SAMN05421630_1011172 [Prauserella marina]